MVGAGDRRRSLWVGALVVGFISLCWPTFLWVKTRGVVPKGQYTVKDRIDQFGGPVRERLLPKFKLAGLNYPPQGVAFVVFKDTRMLQVYARDSVKVPWLFVIEYPVLRASGRLGPKLREGDLQVPEGIYRVESLNPNSLFHVSIRVGYPNAFDRKQAKNELRTGLGGDIMIHGSDVSIGCIAMGDTVAEDLFTLAAMTKVQNVEIIICPTDFRRATKAQLPTKPVWVKSLYSSLRAKLKAFELK